MSTPFLSEIKMMSFNFAPRNWALCDGQTLPINQNQALFSLLGTTYGGNGQTTFQLPNLEGRIPIHMGQGFVLGQVGGEQAHTLTLSEMPAHNHFANANSNTANTTNVPTASLILAASTSSQAYTAFTNPIVMDTRGVSNYGGSQAHNNLQPYLVISFCIALSGIFPSQN
jgi:microcystin-dependent protein